MDIGELKRLTLKPLRPRLFVNHLPEHDWLIALEFGRVDEGQPSESWAGITDDFGYLFDQDEERIVGFKALNFSTIDLTSPFYEPLWNGPRFCAPTLALSDAVAAEVITAARAFYRGRPSINRYYFADAIDAESKNDEVGEWLACVETGDCMAHYGLGISLMESGKPAMAYKHLRFYASIAPMEAWAQYWYARAALAVNEPDEARVAALRAKELSTDPDMTSQARDLLKEIVAN